MNRVAIIGGSGIYHMNDVEFIREHVIDTPFGAPSAPIKEIKINGETYFFLARHGLSHQYSPSNVNYRANIYALKTLQVNAICSVSAVGSLKEELHPGMLVFPDQFIDFTKNRVRSFFSNGPVAHVSLADPISSEIFKIFAAQAKMFSFPTACGGTYVCIEGPSFSTRAESKWYKNLDCSIIGMTNVPEAYLAREANIHYATIALVTDYDAWKDHACTTEEILAVMSKNIHHSQQFLKQVLPLIKQAQLPRFFELEQVTMTKDGSNLEFSKQWYSLLSQ